MAESNSSIVDVEKLEGRAAEFPVVVIRKKIPVTFLYRLPNDPTKCYRFVIKTILVSGRFMMRCNTCDTVNEQARKAKKKSVPSPSWKSDGIFMSEDPAQGHLPDCEPDYYFLLMQRYNLDLSGDQIQQSNGKFLLERLAMKDQYTMLYVLPDSNFSMCYRFLNVGVSGSHFNLACGVCSKNRQSVKNSAQPKGDDVVVHRRCTSDGFLDDPNCQHRPDCKPIPYKTAMKNHEVVDEATARQFLGCFNQESEVVSGPLPKKSRLTAEDYNHCHTADLGQATQNIEVCYSDRVKVEPEFDDGNSISHSNADSQVKHQLDNNVKKEDVLIPASDYLPVAPLPTDNCALNTIEYPISSDCKPASNGEYCDDSLLHRDITNEREFPVEVVRKITACSLLYRLPDDPQRCYRFYRQVLPTGMQILTCTGCRSEYGRNKNVMYRPCARKFDGYSLESDPMIGHVAGCQPKMYNQEIRKYTVISNQPLGEQFKLETLRNKVLYSIVYRLAEQGGIARCFRFSYQFEAGPYMVLYCVTCPKYLRSYQNRNNLLHSSMTNKWRLSDGVLLDDPTMNHHPDCRKSLLYDQVLENFEIVDEDTAKRYLHGLLRDLADSPEGEPEQAAGEDNVVHFC